MQDSAMMRRYQKNGRESYLLGLFAGNTLVVAGIMSVIYERFGRKIFTFSRGPLFDPAHHEDFYDFLMHCKTFAKSKSGSVLQISPSLLCPDAPQDFSKKLKSLGFKYLGEYEQVKWIYALDFSKIDDLPPRKPTSKRTPVLEPSLEPDLEQKLLRHFRRDHRYTIKYAAERYGLKLRELSPSEYQILLDQVAESGKVHGFVPRDLKFFEQMKDAFSDDVVAIAAEMPDGTPIAAAFFILTGDEVIYLSSGFSREFKKLGAPHLIQWAMIRFAYANGYRKYNFWGTNPDPENGVYKFKQGFHGELEEFVGTYAAGLDIFGKIYLLKLHAREQRDL